MQDQTRLLLSVVEGIGQHETGEDGNRRFVKDPDCLPCLKDLQRFLRNDDAKSPEVLLSLGSYNIVGELLVPLILTHVQHTPIVHNALKVIALMTMHPMPGSTKRLEQTKILQNIKDILISNKQILQIAIYRFIQPLQRHPKMTQEDYYTLQVSLILIRNLLAIPDQQKTAGAAGDHRTRMHEKIIQILSEENVFEILIALSQRVKEKPINNEIITMLDIVKCIFDKVDIQKLFDTQIEKQNNLNQMEGMQQQQKLKRQKKKQCIGRHSRFGGVLVRSSKDGGYQQIVSQTTKQKVMANKFLNTVQLQEANTVQKVNLNDQITVKLRQFAMEFLATGYPVLMDALFKEVKSGLGNSNLINRDDFISFFKLSTFFINFTVHLQLRKNRLDQEDKNIYAKLFENGQNTPMQCLSSSISWKTAFVALQQWLLETEKKIKQVDKDWDMQRATQSFLKCHMQLVDYIISNKPKQKQKLNNFVGGTSVDLERDQNKADFQQEARKLQEYKMGVEMSASYLNRDDKKSGMLPVLAQCIKSFSFKFQTQQDSFDLLEMLHTVMKMYDKFDGALDVITSKSRKKQKRDQTVDDQNIEDENIENGEAMQFESDGERDDQQFSYNLNRRIKLELAHPVIICFYINILKNYKKNPTYVNHVIIQFLRRISHKDHLNLEPMLYQLSILNLFLQIMEDKTIQKDPQFFEVLYFCRKVSKNLMSYLLISNKTQQQKQIQSGILQFEDDEENNNVNDENNDGNSQQVVRQEISQMMLIELLFWKNAKSAEDVREEYRWKSRIMSEFEPQNFSQFSSDNEINDGNNAEQINQVDNNNQPQILTQSLKQKILFSFDQHSGKRDWKKLILEDLDSNLKQKDVVEFLKDQGLKKGRISREQENLLLHKYAENLMREDFLEYLAEQIPGGYDAGGIKKLLSRLGVRVKKQGQKRKRNQFAIQELDDLENQSENESENQSEIIDSSDDEVEKSENSQIEQIQANKSTTVQNLELKNSHQNHPEQSEEQTMPKNDSTKFQFNKLKNKNQRKNNQIQDSSSDDDLSEGENHQKGNLSEQNETFNIDRLQQQLQNDDNQNQNSDVGEVVLSKKQPEENIQNSADVLMSDNKLVEDDELNNEEIDDGQISRKRRVLIESDDEAENDPQISNNPQSLKEMRNFQREARIVSDPESNDL